jgi:hypothetical protein
MRVATQMRLGLETKSTWRGEAPGYCRPMRMRSKKKSGAERRGSIHTPSRFDPATLGETAPAAIEPENLQATQALYFAAMLEELRLFQVVDQLVARFVQGLLPLGRGPAGEILYRYWKRGTDGFSETERRNLYARAFGLPGGDANTTPNREFGDLWLRFISAVTAYSDQLTAGQPLPPGGAALRQESVRESARDLATNLSRQGSGLAYFAARELQQQIQEIMQLLSDNEIKSAFAARDLWQVIDQVATLDLGARPNVLRHRTQAEAGATVIRWLTNRRSLLLRPSPVIILKDNDLTRQRAGPKPTITPTDYDLVRACGQWLVVAGTPETPSDGDT